MTQFSFSRAELFNKCPYAYKLRYVDKLRALPNTDDASNALFLGVGIHTGIEQGLTQGINAYYNSFPCINDNHINESLKFENLIPKVRALIDYDKATFEYKLECDEFIGFIDLLVDRGNNEYEIWDFKYSNNTDHYTASAQLHVYKYFFEQLNPDKKVVKLGFIFIPKTQIRQKKTEELCEFRKRLEETLEPMQPKIQEIEYDPKKVKYFLNTVKNAEKAKDFPMEESVLCRWCEYQKYCDDKELDYMLLPENKRREINVNNRKKVWIYGAPFSGKTTLADHFPDPIMLNTDGNLNSFTAPVVEIKETFEGRIKTDAWTNFKNAIEELQKGSDFKTIVVDLVEDTYEHCRRWCYGELGIEHESDNSFKAWDFVRNEFLTVMKRLLTLDYNIVLISHEDATKDITKKTGDKITQIKPNINEKVANKLAGMVDIVARITADGNVRALNFKSDDVVFGGGRLTLTDTTVPCTYDALDAIYKAQPHTSEPVKQEAVVERKRRVVE